jgi:hypothetical protein
MRLTLVAIAALLFSAQAASAAEPSSNQGAQANGQSAQSSKDARRHDARTDQEQIVVAPRVMPLNYPGFTNEQDEANCYYAFGDLKCDRLKHLNPNKGDK